VVKIIFPEGGLHKAGFGWSLSWYVCCFKKEIKKKKATHEST
jgi:hypothetical protein